MKIAVHGRALSQEAKDLIKNLLVVISKKGIDLQLSDSFSEILETDLFPCFASNDGPQADFILSVGGDGTLLETVNFAAQRGIPVLGVNTGRLGFLSNVLISEAEAAIDGLLNDHYRIEERSLVYLESDRELFGKTPFGLNEFTVLKRDTSSMIVVHTYIDGAYLNSYWADGLIVSTPTGSTGYSLSCGGPLLTPNSSGFVITPISPHHLNVRPMVVPDSSVISFEIEGRSEHILVSLDSRSVAVNTSVQLAVRKADFKAKLVKPEGYDFFKTLRKKLNWGMDIRN